MQQAEGRDLKALLGLDFDPRELRKRNAVERNRRLRPDHSAQYQRMRDGFDDFIKDRVKADPIARDALELDLDMLIIGGGFAGIQTGAHLRRNGVDNFRIIERNSGFGGAWYFNRYPGAKNDSEAFIYLPLLEETGYQPTSRYIDAAEIVEHAERIGRHFGLYERALFQTTVTGARWDENAKRWIVETDRGDVFRTRFLEVAGGESWSKPKMPGIPGIRDFKGCSFHAARWNYDYTGGNVHGGLDKLADKRVAFVGTGATGVQVVPHLGAAAKQLYVIQRTPSMVLPRGEIPPDPPALAGREPGWHQKRMENFNNLMEGVPAMPMNDLGFADLFVMAGQCGREIAAKAEAAGVELTPLEHAELSNMLFLEKARAHVGAVVKDPETAEKLKPYFATPWCKRPTWSGTYYETFNRPNVTLVASPGGVERITEKGLVVNGEEIEVDCIIYGSGFELGSTELWQFVQFPLIGRNGLELSDYWADGYHNLHGMFVHNFPNFTQLTLIGNGLGANYLYGNSEQCKHIGWFIRQCLDQGVETFEATREAEIAWQKEIAASHDTTGNERLAAVQALKHACTPSFYNNEGDYDQPRSLLNYFHGSCRNYISLLADWRNTPGMPGLLINGKEQTAGYNPRHKDSGGAAAFEDSASVP